ncbi:MAG TPA: roadblock/LC7 domain-containing protein, partial [Candidatus Melainabacteria bacterium]|nr:roadblock/LC7 domain-containing protein [Candidatus Melainabacteria bacterium]
PFGAPFAAPMPTPETPQAPAPFGAPAPQPFGAQPQAPFNGQQQAPAPFGAPQQGQFAAAPPQAPQAPQAPQQGAGLFSVDDSMMNQIFAENLGVQDQDTQVNQGQQRVNVAAAVQAISDVAGQDPMGAVPPPKIEGLGRLDAKPDQGGDTGSGRIASIGKFLLDQKDLEKIGKLTASDLSDTKMKILTLEAASEIQGLLHHIGGTPDVVGSIIIGHDGLLIANTMPQDVEADSIGIWALAVYMNTETAIKKIGHNRVHQVVARTPRGFLVIADFGGGLLVTLSDGRDTDALIPLMRSITQVVST